MDQKVTLDYTNYKGERGLRLVEPVSIYFGSTEFHQEPQWLLRATDVMRGVSRDFAMKSVHSWGQAAAIGVTPVPLSIEEQLRVATTKKRTATESLVFLASMFQQTAEQLRLMASTANVKEMINGLRDGANAFEQAAAQVRKELA